MENMDMITLNNEKSDWYPNPEILIKAALTDPNAPPIKFQSNLELKIPTDLIKHDPIKTTTNNTKEQVEFQSKHFNLI